MPVERRGQVIAFEIGSTGNGRNPMHNGRRQPSCGGTSRMMREDQVRICERLGVSRDRLDVMVLPAAQCCSVPNDTGGWGALVERLRGSSIAAIAVEATGGHRPCD